MKYLKIKNNGILDIRLVALMGGTTKSNDDFKIGQFGTGLKYTLAFLIRNNIDFHIFAGKDKIKIDIETELIRNENFNIICINGNRTSITDKMGQEWSAWMIIRELWCNALDEGGSSKTITPMDFSLSDLNGEENTTTFYIQMTKEIQDVFNNWDKYFLQTKTPLFLSLSGQCAIYPGGESLRIYKNGVLIKEINENKSLYAYDLKNAQINELREYNGSVSYPIFKCLQNADVKTISHFIENINEDYYESDADYNWFEKFGETWIDAIGNCKLIYPKALQTIRERGIEVDMSEIICVPEKIYKVLTSQFDGIGALRVADKINEFYETFSLDADNKIKQGLVILEEAGYNFSPELKFIYGVFGDKNIWAKISFDKKEVLISENISDKSIFEVITTLIEENEHFKSGFSDCTREFQQHFIDLYTNKLLKLAKINL